MLGFTYRNTYSQVTRFKPLQGQQTGPNDRVRQAAFTVVVALIAIVVAAIITVGNRSATLSHVTRAEAVAIAVKKHRVKSQHSTFKNIGSSLNIHHFVDRCHSGLVW